MLYGCLLSLQAISVLNLFQKSFTEMVKSPSRTALVLDPAAQTDPVFLPTLAPPAPKAALPCPSLVLCFDLQGAENCCLVHSFQLWHHGAAGPGEQMMGVEECPLVNDGC